MPIHLPTVVPNPDRVAELDRLGDEIAELSAHLDAATARLLALIREFDARGGWNTGFRSCAAWLSWRVGLDLGAERIVRGWRLVDRQAEARETARRHASRALHVYQDEDGMVVVRGRLAPEVGALLLQALGAAREALYQRARGEAAATPAADPSGDAPTRTQQQADALALLAETALHHGFDSGGPGERYQVVVHVDAPVLADPHQPGQSVLEDGARVSAETSRRLACDASRVVLRHDDEGRLVEIGARTRTIPPALRRALHHRDRGCRFPGCSVRVGQGHHLHHWAQGGPTTLSNLALLCRRHHRAVHEEGYQVARGPDGVLRFRRPDGRPLLEVPPSAQVLGDPVKLLRARHDSQGLRLTARTACPGWLGERLDVGWAIDVLHPRAGRPA
jgi:5-methylcytosine-specific restriction endonuclease McrA